MGLGRAQNQTNRSEASDHVIMIKKRGKAGEKDAANYRNYLTSGSFMSIDIKTYPSYSCDVLFFNPLVLYLICSQPTVCIFLIKLPIQTTHS